jgi:FkbM family methyltransferase
MKKSSHELLQNFLQNVPKSQRMLSLLGPLLPASIYGECNGYWMKFDLAEAIQCGMYLNKYEPVQSQWVRDILNKGDAFLDVGANVGYYTTLSASLVGTNGRVIAFEPSPYAYKKLKSIIQENSIVQVELFQCAAGDKNCQLNLYLPNEGHLHSPSLVKSNDAYIPIKVEVCCLDSHPSLASQATIDMMKIDIEGFEPNALRGMQDYLQSGRIRYLMCEFNSGWLEPNGSSCEELLEMINGMGFAIHKQTKKITATAKNGLTYEHQDILFKHLRPLTEK